MNAACRDVRIWGPLLVASAAILLRGAPPPLPSPAGGSTVRAVELPPLHGLAEPSHTAVYEFDATRSSVRLAGADATARDCPDCAASLVWSTDGDARTLDLQLHLPAPGRAVTAGEPLSCRAALRRREPHELPGVSHQEWSGHLHHAGRATAVAFDLWQVLLPGQPLRLQGRVALPADTFVPPRHGHTLGLDLAFRRRSGR